MGKGTDNKIRKNLIISCLVELIGRQLRGKNVETQKDSVKAQLEEHLSAKLVVKIIQDLHERLDQKARAEFAVNLLADVQLLRNGKIPTASKGENILPKAIAAISQLIPGATQAEASTPSPSSTASKANAKSADETKPPAENKTEPEPGLEPTQQQPKAQQPQQAEQPQEPAQPSPTNQESLAAAVSKSVDEKEKSVTSDTDNKRPLEEQKGDADLSPVVNKTANEEASDASESPKKKQKLEVDL